MLLRTILADFCNHKWKDFETKVHKIAVISTENKK